MGYVVSIPCSRGCLDWSVCRPANAKLWGFPGKAVQVGPMKPTLKAPGTKRLKVDYDETLLNLAFKFKLCRYTQARTARALSCGPPFRYSAW